ncbi:MAG: HAMP domain-containing sensor histidine kinase [Acidobacteriota bacterium]|nr:HAMP domain-containing sensor histidine kinase [Acidobacteriota bacterium]
MLHEFITANRDAIIERTRERVKRRAWPSVSAQELEHGVPRFLTQLADTLRMKDSPEPFSPDAITAAAAKHGAELFALGYNVSQVVNGYGEICQSVTHIAIEQNAPITVEEFKTLNLCLDIAIAGAVTEHARITAQTPSAEEVERLGHSAHELRDVLNSAILAFHALRRGTVAINGSTGEILGRSLMSLRDMIDRTVAQVRLAATQPRRERLPVVVFLDEIGATGMLHSEYRGIRFTIEPTEPNLAVHADAPLLTSAVMNLLHNAFKNTPSGGRVILRAQAKEQRLFVEIEDECGGIPLSKGDLFQAFGDRRGTDRSGLGLGLSIARSAVRAHGGDITIRNMPGKGCVFVIELSLVTEGARATQPELEPSA